MLQADGLLILLFISLVAISWWHHTRAREVARQMAHQACREAGVQLLDDSVGLRRLRVRRRQGTWQVERIFRFDFSRDGADRWTGSLELEGHALKEVVLDLHHPAGEEP